MGGGCYSTDNAARGVTREQTGGGGIAQAAWEAQAPQTEG